MSGEGVVVVAEFDPPRYEVQEYNVAKGWRQVATRDREFEAKVAAEKWTIKNDVRTRVIDRRPGE